MEHDRIEAYHEGQAKGLPLGYVATIKDLVESPQYAARSFFRNVDHPVTGPTPYPRLPMRFGELPDGPWRPAPRLGEHNAAVYGEMLGYTKEDLVRLHAMEII
jgi:crotonobetainyl-CoA:carnitine CoA-transferase CaiB-like acyl-CoA transferase